MWRKTTSTTTRWCWQEHDAAVVIEEKDLTPERLQRAGWSELCRDPQTLRRLGRNAQAMAIIDANERIYSEIMALYKA